jgi:hypothetical protein
MTPREIIARAWAITTQEPVLRRWGFLAAFLETLLNVKLLGYQAYFAWAYYVGKQVGFFDDFLWLYHSVSLTWFLTIVIGFALLLTAEFFVPHVCAGAIIGLSAKAHRGEPMKGGLVLALHNFFAIFAVHEIFVLSGWATLVSVCSLQLRYIDGDLKYAGIIGACIIFCISNTLKLFAGFAEEAVVLRKKSIGGGVAQSYKLLLSHTSQIMFILLLLFVISLRIVVNVLVIALIPGVVLGIGVLLTFVLSPLVSYLIAGGIGVLLIIAASYFFAYLHVFKQAVWTITYIEFSSHRELDHIDIDEEPAQALPTESVAA